MASSTSREIEILRLLARGLSNKQIASRLTISAKTAGSYVEHIFAKIGVGNRAMASLYAAKHQEAHHRWSRGPVDNRIIEAATRTRRCAIVHLRLFKIATELRGDAAFRMPRHAH